MKLVAVIGSPNGMKGNTGKMLQAALDGAKEAGATVQVFSLADKPVKPCRGCSVCHVKGKCPIKDGFADIRDAMLAADAIVLASPNYIFSVSAQMKALLDRCCGPLHCQGFVGKYGAAVVTSGGTGGEEVCQYMLRFLRAMGCLTVGSTAATAREVGDPASRQRVLDAADALGRDLVSAVKEQRKFPEQAQEREVFFARFKGLMAARRTEWPYEYEHWQKQGWL